MTKITYFTTSRELTGSIPNQNIFYLNEGYSLCFVDLTLI